jgi:acyl carrier protein
VEFHQAPPELTCEQFRARVQGRVAREEELVVSPEFFHVLKTHVPRISRVEVQLKPGNFHNEVTRFRYDVILQIEGPASCETEIPWLDGVSRDWTLATVRQQVAENHGKITGIRRVPNARLDLENHLLRWMNGENGPETLGEFRNRLPVIGTDSVDPQKVNEMSREPGFELITVWPADADGSGAYDVCFLPATSSGPTSRPIQHRAWTEYANQPARSEPDAKLISQLRSHLRQTLPDIMVPGAFVLLPAMPLTPNGKINRRALPAPDSRQPEPSENFIAPETPIEKALAGIWREVLGLEAIGVGDDFFKLGGHSLLATQLVSQIRELFKIELPLRALFEAPTIAKFAPRLIAAETVAGTAERTASILNQLEAMSAGEVDEALEQRKKPASSKLEETLSPATSGV